MVTKTTFEDSKKKLKDLCSKMQSIPVFRDILEIADLR